MSDTRRRTIPFGRWAVVLGCVLFFAAPLVALALFSFTSKAGWSTDAYTAIAKDPQFWKSVGLSLTLAVVTTALSLLLMVPTVLWVHMRAPSTGVWWRPSPCWSSPYRRSPW